MTFALKFAERKLSSSIEAMHGSRGKQADKDSILAALYNAIKTVEEWSLQKPFCATSNLSKSQFIVLTTQSMSWCIDALVSDITACVDARKEEQRVHHNFQTKCIAARTRLWECLILANPCEFGSDAKESFSLPCAPQADENDLHLSRISNQDICGVATLVVKYLDNSRKILGNRDIYVSKLECRIRNLQSTLEGANAASEGLRQEISEGKVEYDFFVYTF